MINPPATDARQAPGRFNGTEIEVCGQSLVPDCAGALYWPDQDVLIISDLHFEKGSSFARRGVHLPPYDTASTLDLVETQLSRYRPKRVVALGDSFHDDQAPDRLDADDAGRIRALTARVDWLWVRGNHDRDLDGRFGGSVHDLVDLSPLVLRHLPETTGADGEIAGHLHPKARLSTRGRQVRGRCFASNGRRLVMPALGAFTGGLNVLSAPFRAVFHEAPFHAWMLGRDGVYPVASHRLAPD